MAKNITPNVRIQYLILLTVTISLVWLAIAIPGICRPPYEDTDIEWWLAALSPNLVGLIMLWTIVLLYALRRK